MKKFESAYLEIIYFDVSDVVYTSGGLINGGSGDGDEDTAGNLFGPLA